MEYEPHEGVNEVTLSVQGRDELVTIEAGKTLKVKDDPALELALEAHPQIKRAGKKAKAPDVGKEG